MPLILDLSIKTVLERSDAFHIWNVVCDNFFFFFNICLKRVESKPFIQDALEGDRNVLGFSSSSL